MQINLRYFDVAVHFGGSVAKSLRSTRLINIERIHDGCVITLGGLVLIVSHTVKTE